MVITFTETVLINLVQSSLISSMGYVDEGLFEIPNCSNKNYQIGVLTEYTEDIILPTD